MEEKLENWLLITRVNASTPQGVRRTSDAKPVRRSVYQKIILQACKTNRDLLCRLPQMFSQLDPCR